MWILPIISRQANNSNTKKKKKRERESWKNSTLLSSTFFFLFFIMQKRWQIKFISANKKRLVQCKLKGCSRIQGNEPWTQILNYNYSKKRLENKMHEEKLRHQLLLFWKSTFLWKYFTEKFWEKHFFKDPY